MPAATTVVLVAWLAPLREWLIVAAGFVAGLAAVLLATRSVDQGPYLEALVCIAVVFALCQAIRTLRRETTRHDHAMQNALHQTSISISAAQARRDRVRVREGILAAVDADIEVVLHELADGTLDPAQPTTRARIEAREIELRTVLAIACHAGPLGERLVPKVNECRAKGCRLAVRGLSPSLNPPDAIIDALDVDLKHAISSSRNGAQISLSGYSTAHGAGLFLEVSNSDLHASPDVSPAPWRSISVSAGTALVEYTW